MSKTKTIKLPDTEWLNNFKAFTLRPNFVLALSRSMTEYLCAVADDVSWDRATYGMRTIHAPDNWFSTSKSLLKRGLIVRKPQEEIEAAGRKYQASNWSADHSYSCYDLTPAGKAVVNLLKITGMFIEQDTAIVKKLRRNKA